MKTRGFVVTIFWVAFAIAPQLVTPSIAAPVAAGGGKSGNYSAQLITPRAGQVFYPGQEIRIEWKDTLPSVQYFSGCEMEVWLSLDGGRTFQMCITPILNPKTTYFDWTVPNTPSNAAVLDIRFGCEGFYPESYSPQAASTFVIASR
jgi:hypothetical protein